MALNDILTDLDAQKARIQSNLDKLQNKPVKPLTESRTEGPGKRLTETERLIIASEAINTDRSRREIGREYGVSDETVRRLAKDEDLQKKLQQASQIKKALSSECYITADQAIRHTQNKMDGLNAYQSAIVAATMIDKARLIEGQNTQLIGISAIIDLVGALRGYQSSPVDVEYTPITNDTEEL